MELALNMICFQNVFINARFIYNLLLSTFIIINIKKSFII